MSGDVPEGWTHATLGSLADITRGVSWRDENETNETTVGALPVLGIRNVQQSLKLDETVWLGGLSEKAVASSTVRFGDILMVGSNGNPARIGNAVRINVPGVYLAAGEGLKAFEDLTGGIEAEAGAHTELGMDERAFAILRIMEPHAPDAEHGALQAVAVEVGDLYATAQASQPSWFFMDGYKKELRRDVRKVLRALELNDANAVRDEIENYAIHAYAGSH